MRVSGQQQDVTRILTPLYGGTFAADTGQALPFVLPGELVTVDPLAILEPSSTRVTPGCSHFGTCGGCQYQHADYASQLELKLQVLRGVFSAAGLAEPPLRHTESAEPYLYRNRIRLRIEPDSTGSLRAGYSLRGTNQFLPVTMCPIAAPLLWRAASTILALAATDALARRWLATTSELELFCSPDESKLQLQLFLRSADAAKHEAPSFSALCERLQAAIPELTGAGAALDPDLSRRARRTWRGTGWGAEGLSYPVAGRTYWLPRGAFFQVNRFLVDRLVDLVTANLSGDLAWDLYAGVGLFTRALADRFTRVVSVEGDAAAIASLHSAARVQKGIEPVHSPTLDFLQAHALQRERPSLIVLDPPRAGIGTEAAHLLSRFGLSRFGAPTIVYVSCDPTTLARDLAILTTSYTLESVTLIDLFPQTFHIETISVLNKTGTAVPNLPARSTND